MSNPRPVIVLFVGLAAIAIAFGVLLTVLEKRNATTTSQSDTQTTSVTYTPIAGTAVSFGTAVAYAQATEEARNSSGRVQYQYWQENCYVPESTLTADRLYPTWITVSERMTWSAGSPMYNHPEFLLQPGSEVAIHDGQLNVYPERCAEKLIERLQRVQFAKTIQDYVQQNALEIRGTSSPTPIPTR